MPKFYHGERLGLAYRVRAVGWRRIFPFSLLPYLTGDEIKIHLSVKLLYEGEKWQQGILQVEPPDLSEDEPRIVLSNWVFEFGEWPIGKWWRGSLPLKGGVPFRQPVDVECTVVFQNFNGDKLEQTAPIPIANIEVVSRGPFLTNIFMWVGGIILSFLLGYLLHYLVG